METRNSLIVLVFGLVLGLALAVLWAVGGGSTPVKAVFLDWQADAPGSAGAGPADVTADSGTAFEAKLGL